MHKKLLIATSFIMMTIFSFSICHANDGLTNATNGVRNVVGNAENAVEDAAKNISNASKDATGKMEQGANDVVNNNRNNMNNINTNNNNYNNNNYTATRTATTNRTFMGMNSTAWTWLIMGIVGIAIVALVWYYSMQLRSSNYDGRN